MIGGQGYDEFYAAAMIRISYLVHRGLVDYIAADYNHYTEASDQNGKSPLTKATYLEVVQNPLKRVPITLSPNPIKPGSAYATPDIDVKKLRDHTDMKDVIRIILNLWDNRFQNKFQGRNGDREKLEELMAYRDKAAHQKQFTLADLQSAKDIAWSLLMVLEQARLAQEVNQIYNAHALRHVSPSDDVPLPLNDFEDNATRSIAPVEPGNELYIQIVYPDQRVVQYQLPIDEPRIVVGRGPNSAFYIADSAISRLHLVIVRDAANNLTITDLTTKSGTKLNGAKLESGSKYAWKAGETVQIGNTLLILRSKPGKQIVNQEQPQHVNGNISSTVHTATHPLN